MNPEEGRGAALITLAMLQDFREQRDFHFAQNDLVDIILSGAIQIMEITLHRLGDMFP